MFIGHFAVGFAAKRAAPRANLGTLFAAAQWLDLLWPVFLLLDLEHVRIEPGNTALTPLDFYDYPWTHSLAAVAGWSVAFALVHFALKRRARDAAILGLLVASHWVIDLLVHKPDLPLWPGGPLVGFGLWNQPSVAILLEVALFAAGFLVYVRCTRPRDAIGRFGLAALALLLLAIHSGNLFGLPPPSVEMIAVAGNAQWLFVLLAFWVDRHREPV